MKDMPEYKQVNCWSGGINGRITMVLAVVMLLSFLTEG